VRLLASKGGTIFLNGKKVNPKELCRSTYMVMQDADYQLFTESVLHEIQLADRKRQSKRHEADPQIIKEVLNRFGLRDIKTVTAFSLRRTETAGHDCCGISRRSICPGPG
jgi:energy-coupling factor transporter ATP-binding protein EcfA2